MIKKIGLGLLVLIFVFCFSLGASAAEDKALNTLKGKLRDVRQEINKETNTYKQQLSKLRNEITDKIEAARKEFHKTRDACLAEQKNKEGALLEDCNAKITPLTSEELSLMNQIEPLEPNNFVKRKE